MLKEIAEHLGIKLIEVEPGDELCKGNGEDSYINKSYICGRDRIELGIYEDPELKIASFFHEIGHTMISYKWKLKHSHIETEERAWMKGYNLAAFYGIKFQEYVKDWAKEQVKTYI